MTDLVTRLQEAVATATENERSDLAYKPAQVCGLHLEQELANNGTVVDSVC